MLSWADAEAAVLFNSLPFLVFFPLFAVLFFSTRGRARLAVCLVSSYVFYGWWDWRFLGLIGLSTGVDYSIGLRLGIEADPRIRARLVAASVAINLGVLGTFKYLGFFVESFADLAATFGVDLSGPTIDLILPVGISFYTFQTMSYTLDLYWKKIEVEPSLLRFATFVAFFPQLVAGPIVRASALLPQLARDPDFDWDRFTRGFGQVLWGFFKKVAVADTVAALVDGRFANPELHSSISLTAGVFFYAFQIYCDFSGYSDIAIGIGRMLGYDLGENFRSPYFSRSFGEFWRRWHISLSSWLRDYLYIPLGGNRDGSARTYRNLAITMLLGGLWHGASWNFVIWGALHGLYLVTQRLLGGRWSALVRRLRIPGAATAAIEVAVVFALTCFAWIFFRAATLGDALTIIDGIAALEGLGFASVPQKFLVVRGLLIVALLLVCELAAGSQRVRRALETPGGRIASYAACLWLIAFFGTFDGTQFIYFQF